MVARVAVALGVTADEILGLRQNGQNETAPTLRIMQRVMQIETLPLSHQKTVLRLVDLALKGAEAELKTRG